MPCYLKFKFHRPVFYLATLLRIRITLAWCENYLHRQLGGSSVYTSPRSLPLYPWAYSQLWLGPCLSATQAEDGGGGPRCPQNKCLGSVAGRLGGRRQRPKSQFIFYRTSSTKPLRFHTCILLVFNFFGRHNLRIVLIQV